MSEGAVEAGTERRQETRVSAQHPVIIEWQTQQGELHRARGTTRDLALGGFYCVTERPLPEGSPVEFSLVFPAQLSGGQPVKLRCTGRIVRSERTGQQSYGAAVSIESSQAVETLQPSVDVGQHRIYARIVPATTVQAEYPGMRSVLRDLSLAGAFIEDERPLPVGRVFKLRLSSEKLPTEIEVAAVVRRSQPHVGMAVEFIALSQEAKQALQEVVQQGQPWRGAEAAFPSAAWQPAPGEKGPVQLEQAIEFVRQRAARGLPQLEVLACHYRVGEKTFALHLREPVSRAELLLPISERWVLECQSEGDCSHLDRALGSASRLLALEPPPK